MFINSHAIHPSFDLFHLSSRHQWQFIYIPVSDYMLFKNDGNTIIYFSPDIVLCMKKAIIYLLEEAKQPIDMSCFDCLWAETDVRPPHPGWRALQRPSTAERISTLEHNTKYPLMLSIRIVGVDEKFYPMEYHLFYAPRRVERSKEYREIYKRFRTHYKSYMTTKTLTMNTAQICAVKMTARHALETLLQRTLDMSDCFVDPEGPYEYLLTRFVT